MRLDKLALMTGICLFIAAPVLAESTTTSTTEKTGINSALGRSPSTADFVKEAAISDMFEIQSSQMALQKGDDAAKTFANQMIADHQKTTEELKSLVQSANAGVTPPTTLDSTHQQMLDRLTRLSGEGFTRKYDQDQVSAHKSAVSLFRRYAKGGDNAQLKDWAAKTLPTLEHHLQMAQALPKPQAMNK